jgi:hypothetical protein
MTETVRGGKRKCGDFAHGVKLRKKVFWQASRRKRYIERQRRSAALFRVPVGSHVAQTPTQPCLVNLTAATDDQ